MRIAPATKKTPSPHRPRFDLAQHPSQPHPFSYETASWLAELAAGPQATFEDMLQTLMRSAGINDLGAQPPSPHAARA
jgi:hypothetical protein